MPFGSQSTAEDVTQGLDLTGQTWLITGMNSGLGFESARVLALRGARIIGAARTEAKAADAFREMEVDGVPVACELSEPDSVRAAIERVTAVGTPLAGILANAGVMAIPDLRQHNGIEMQFQTNHVGHFLLVTGLLDQLTSDGRVVILSSGAHFMAKRGLELDNLSGERDYDPWRMYGRSKLANILFARSLAARFGPAGRTANAVHPGVIQTNLTRHVQEPERLFASMRNRLKTVAQGAATQCYVAVNPESRPITGAYFADCAVAETLDEAKDDALADALWEKTEAILAS